MLPGMQKYLDQGAEFDVARRNRFRLWRTWGHNKRIALWIMLNPSTADEDDLDQTLRKVEMFSRTWWFDGFEVCNLFPMRSTDPEALYDVDWNRERLYNAETAALFAMNDQIIWRCAEDAAQVIVGWGTEEIARGRAREIARLLHEREIVTMCLGTNKDGSPKHPLYLPYTTERIAWAAAA